MTGWWLVMSRAGPRTIFHLSFVISHLSSGIQVACDSFSKTEMKSEK